MSRKQGVIHQGKNSGYQALNLAYLLGAERILLLGYDMQTQGDKRHWFGAHPDGLDPKRVRAFAERARSLADDASKLRTLLKCVSSLEGEKAIVFTQFIRTLYYLKHVLEATLKDVVVGVFHGKLTKEAKDAEIDNFSLATNTAEYLQEEGRDLPARVEVDAWLEAVDRIREHADRLETRLARLESRRRAAPREP